MDSTPPAMASSISPLAMARKAVPMASMPEAQRRLRVTPGTLSGTPASNKAMRATLRLSSPAWLAQPMNTSSTAVRSSCGLRSISAFSGTAAKSSARTGAKPPPKRPMGVRNASQIKTSRLIPHPQPGCGRLWYVLPVHAGRPVRLRSVRRFRQACRQSESANRWPRSPARGSRPGAAR
ncbi:hypothetical protein FQZ97_1008150 [compost metagenome]